MYMNQIKQKTKQNKKSDVIAAVAVLANAAMIFTTGTSHMIHIQDVLAKNRNVPDLPLKTEECKHDTTIGPSCKDSEAEIDQARFLKVSDQTDDDVKVFVGDSETAVEVDQARFLKVSNQVNSDNNDVSQSTEQEIDDVEEGSHAENDAGNNVSSDDGDGGDENVALPAVQRIREAAAPVK